MVFDDFCAQGALLNVNQYQNERKRQETKSRERKLKDRISADLSWIFNST